MKGFDPYEFIAVIAPGTVVAVGIFAQWPEARTIFLSKDFSLGELGIFVICAFVLGHLVQSIGNIVETVFFAPVGGMPTNWVLQNRPHLIALSQRDRLRQRLIESQGASFSFDIPKRDWYSITREIYASVAASGRSARVDAFDRAYGLLRGIASAFILLAIWSLVVHWGDWRWFAVSAVLATLALTRMGRFAKLYARELLVQFLMTPSQSDQKQPTPPGTDASPL